MNKDQFEYKGIVYSLYKGIVIPKTPPHINIDLNKYDIDRILNASKAYFLRRTTNWDYTQQTEWWFIIKDKKSSIEELSRNTRNQVRKGLKNCDIYKINSEYIYKSGYDVYQKAFDRYRTFLKPTSKECFQQDIKATQNNLNIEYWGAFSKKRKLIAYSRNDISEDMCNYSVIKADPDYLRLYPIYALVFEMNNYYLNDLKLKYVNDGARSISHETNIQEFLIHKFKFRKAYCRLNIAYSPKVKILIPLLFPFSGFFRMRKGPILQKLNVLLTQEKIRRTFS